ncbi:5-bromo-4-chloroindolyl phosphate hydrolysis family protein, partial [Bacillus sp. WP8]|uniref:5-bromo-4-chloroindolyl phosphate hydrolysis family protein n=1 Tax=Bacillus sp. WP8 TaxID=756828 RepID=UPI0021B69A06
MDDDVGLWIVYGMIGWGVMFGGRRWVGLELFLKKEGVCGSDYVYMKEDLKEGGEKVVGLKKGLFGVKNVERMTHTYEIV